MMVVAIIPWKPPIMSSDRASKGTEGTFFTFAVIIRGHSFNNNITYIQPLSPNDNDVHFLCYVSKLNILLLYENLILSNAFIGHSKIRCESNFNNTHLIICVIQSFPPFFFIIFLFFSLLSAFVLFKLYLMVSWKKDSIIAGQP